MNTNHIIREVSTCAKCGFPIDITDKLEEDVETHLKYRDVEITCPICGPSWARIKNDTDIF